MVQSVECPTLAQVMISRLMSSSPAWGSVLTTQSLEPVSDSVSPFLSTRPVHALSLSVSKINIKKFLKKECQMDFNHAVLNKPQFVVVYDFFTIFMFYNC